MKKVKKLMTWGDLSSPKVNDMNKIKNAPTSIRFAAYVYQLKGIGHPSI